MIWKCRDLRSRMPILRSRNMHWSTVRHERHHQCRFPGLDTGPIPGTDIHPYPRCRIFHIGAATCDAGADQRACHRRVRPDRARRLAGPAVLHGWSRRIRRGFRDVHQLRQHHSRSQRPRRTQAVARYPPTVMGVPGGNDWIGGRHRVERRGCHSRSRRSPVWLGDRPRQSPPQR